MPKIKTGIDVISRETLELWYALIAKYVEKKPDDKSMHIFLSKQPALVEKADKMIESVERLRRKEKAVEILGSVVDEIV
jgi:hypothetical protein